MDLPAFSFLHQLGDLHQLTACALGETADSAIQLLGRGQVQGHKDLCLVDYL